MLKAYKFTAYNSQALYGWGNEAEADAYATHLNRDREINVYGFAEVVDEDEVAKLDAGYGDQINLGDELIAIRDAE